MKNHFIFTVILACALHSNIKSQSIFDKVAEVNDPGITKYTEYKIATSNAYAYLLDGYEVTPIHKVVYMINVEAKKGDDYKNQINASIKERFESIGINAANILDLKCTECNTGEKMKAYLKENGYDCLLQITLDSERRTANFLTTQYFKLYGNMVSSYTKFGTVSSVYAVLEWYNFENEEIPFLKSWMYKQSSGGLGNRLYTVIESAIVGQILRVADQGLIINNKKKKK